MLAGCTRVLRFSIAKRGNDSIDISADGKIRLHRDLTIHRQRNGVASDICEELRPWGRSFSATKQGRLWRRIDRASLDLAVNGEACALARGHARSHARIKMVATCWRWSGIWIDNLTGVKTSFLITHRMGQVKTMFAKPAVFRPDPSPFQWAPFSLPDSAKH